MTIFALSVTPGCRAWFGAAAMALGCPHAGHSYGGAEEAADLYLFDFSAMLVSVGISQR
jgi:hypothetical protein